MERMRDKKKKTARPKNRDDTRRRNGGGENSDTTSFSQAPRTSSHQQQTQRHSLRSRTSKKKVRGNMRAVTLSCVVGGEAFEFAARRGPLLTWAVGGRHELGACTSVPPLFSGAGVRVGCGRFACVQPTRVPCPLCVSFIPCLLTAAAGGGAVAAWSLTIT